MIDILGIITRQVDGETPDDPVTHEPRPGWHVNVSDDVLAAHPALEPYRVSPPRMRCVFAGDDYEAPGWTVPLRFADEAEGRAALEAEGLIVDDAEA